jgi:hypothetical protein
MLIARRALVALILPATISGCGTYVPYMQEITDGHEATLDAGGVLERNIKVKIYCELKAAVIDFTDPSSPDFFKVFRKQKYSQALPDDWGVELTLNLEVDESSAANPGVTANSPPATPAPPVFSIGLGGTLSSTASRIDKFTSFYLVKDLKVNLGRADPCFNEIGGNPRGIDLTGSSFLTSDLRIQEWLKDALTVENSYKSEATDPSKKDDVFSYEVKFVVITNGNVTPAWKLVRVSTSQGQPLAALGRTRSHDLLITFGPTESPKNGATPSFTTAASNSHLASQIGIAVSSGIRGFLPGSSLPVQ